MKIPITFKLRQRQPPYKVHRTALRISGRIYPELQRIEISRHLKNRRAAKTFWHELTHAILFDMGRADWDDETFVVEFSRRLEQAVHSARF